MGMCRISVMILVVLSGCFYLKPTDRYLRLWSDSARLLDHCEMKLVGVARATWKQHEIDNDPACMDSWQENVFIAWVSDDEARELCEGHPACHISGAKYGALIIMTKDKSTEWNLTILAHETMHKLLMCHKGDGDYEHHHEQWKLYDVEKEEKLDTYSADMQTYAETIETDGVYENCLNLIGPE